MRPEDELDDDLTRAFRSARQPMPSPGFAARTMKAVRRAPLPAGRKPLSHPLSALVGWAALIAGAAAMIGVVMTQPLIGRGFASLLSTGVGLGVWLVGGISSGILLADVLSTAGLAVGRAVATKEATTGLMLLTAVGALSLSALHRLLISKGEAPRWQELS
jgi:hypothetical protein